jgi:tetratricopeptide (TPR) repeat protein
MGIDITMELSNYGIGSGEAAASDSAAPTLATRASNRLVPAQALDCFQSGMESLGMGEAGDARRWFEKAITADPTFADGHVGLGIALAVEYDIYTAIDHLERAAQLEPGNFYAHFKLGQLYFKLRVPRKGYDEMARALDCVSSLAERRLVAQLIKEEKQREKNDVQRPWWNKGFSRRSVALGLCGVTALFAAAVIFLR